MKDRGTEDEMGADVASVLDRGGKTPSQAAPKSRANSQSCSKESCNCGLKAAPGLTCVPVVALLILAR